jgi:uncharacterized membrane protein
MLLLAALIGILAGVGQTYEAVMGLSFIAQTEKWLFEFKIFLLTGVFIYAFFKFTWALRQYNYACALIGAAPPPDAPSARTEALAEHTAEVLSLAVTSFNGGLRAYYFALAALAWFRPSRAVHDPGRLDAAGSAAPPAALPHASRHPRPYRRHGR